MQRRTTWSFRLDRRPPAEVTAISDLRPGERFRNRFRRLARNPILSLQASLSRKPFVCGRVHESVTFNHFPASFGKRRYTEFHSTGHGPAVPWSALAAAVLLPD